MSVLSEVEEVQSALSGECPVGLRISTDCVHSVLPSVLGLRLLLCKART